LAAGPRARENREAKNRRRRRPTTLSSRLPRCPKPTSFFFIVRARVRFSSLSLLCRFRSIDLSLAKERETNESDLFIELLRSLEEKFVEERREKAKAMFGKKCKRERERESLRRMRRYY
jgi:hypothetical protein